MKNLFFKNKNSQVAMEFLMTYGWALLVVLIAIAALVFFGLLEPSRFLPEKIELPAGFIVQGSAWDGQDNVLDIFVYNGIGQRVTDFQLEIEGCSPSDSVRIIPGSTEKITVFCDDITAKAR
ncbi:MAG: hypothetical protein ACMXX5_01445, partial [Candidatus Woesearchaeota archaeon]